MKQIFLAKVFLFVIINLCYSQQLVLPGDYPDPSVVKIGDSYWASATTSNWAPAYPLLQSKDLVHWETKGFVFPQLPAWTDYYFWAPEVSYDWGKVYIYYSAHKRDGNLCIGVASADKPEGPYRDHGTLMCEQNGSIDAFPMRDEHGKLFLIWKEDSNSANQVTKIWAMQMNEERTTLIGERTELFRNDVAWEANLVEGVSMIRHGDYYYAFYAGSGCCGRECTYATGIARSKNLLGPWEKYSRNPLFTGNDVWKCPGHGTPIEKDGKFYLLYHGYYAGSNVYAGRQGLLKEFKFNNDGWIEMVEDVASTPAMQKPITDDFNNKLLSLHWQWSVFQTLDYKLEQGKFFLKAMPAKSGAFVGQRIFTSDYEASVTVFAKESNAAAGIAVIGDEKNIVAATVKGDVIEVFSMKHDVLLTINTLRVKNATNLRLKVTVRNGKEIQFAYSVNKKNFITLNEQAIDGTHLPPWDRAVRVGLISKGDPAQRSVFDKFVLKSFSSPDF